MSTFRIQAPRRLGSTGRRFGYVVAVGVNALGLVIVNNVLEWGWLSFLTADLAKVVPWLNVSLTAALAANLIYLFWDRPAFRSATQIVLNLVTFVVTYQFFRVFPFDFSIYTFNWGVVVRILLILTMVGAAVGVLTETYKFASGESANDKEVTDANGI